jgi:hypothetical protein
MANTFKTGAGCAAGPRILMAKARSMRIALAKSMASIGRSR